MNTVPKKLIAASQIYHVQAREGRALPQNIYPLSVDNIQKPQRRILRLNLALLPFLNGRWIYVKERREYTLAYSYSFANLLYLSSTQQLCLWNIEFLKFCNRCLGEPKVLGGADDGL